MSEREDYSDYIAVLSNTTNLLALITGFMFASLTVLLTALPDLSSLSSQTVLLIAAFFLDVFVFLLLNASSLSQYYVKMPPVTRRIASFNLLLYLALMFGMGMVTTAMFFAYGLTYLGLAQLVMWITLSVLTHFYVMMPVARMRRSRGG